MFVNINSLQKYTKVNGPGLRYLVRFQGCPHNCKGCFNPEACILTKNKLFPIIDIYEKVINTKGIEGVTFSGGEPLIQFDALKTLIKLLVKNTNLSIIVYTGFKYPDLSNNIQNFLSNQIDVLIDGKYDKSLKTNFGFIGSSNQKTIFFSKKYSIKDFDVKNKIEILKSEKEIRLLGFPTSNLQKYYLSKFSNYDI